MKEYSQQICVTNSRLLVPIKVNGKVVYFLIDTGSQVPLIDINQQKSLSYGLKNKLSGTITGVGGEGGDVYHTKNLDVDFEGKKLYQFVATDLSNIREIIKKETDYDIAGILSLKLMLELGWIIDLATGKIYYKDGLN